MRIVFFGTSRFAVPALEALVNAGMRPVLVVTTPDAPVGRKRVLSPSPLKAKALELGLEIIQPKTLKGGSRADASLPPKNPEVLAKISAVKPDVGVLAAYGKIIPKALIEAFPKGIVNVHPSLLPRWRGATPIQAAMLAGDEKTGVTLTLLDEEVDHGPILAQQELRMPNDKTQMSNVSYPALHDMLAELGADLLVETLPKWVAGELSPSPQEHSKATFCKKLSREDAKIDWSKPAVEIERMVRAFNPEPGTWMEYEDRKRDEKKILKILKVSLLSSSYRLSSTLMAGTFFEHEKKLAVQCGTDALILEIVQPEGKKPMPGADWLRGHRGAMTNDL